VAVRHGADHIHIVAMLARQDGGKPRLSNERYRVREACRVAEERYGLWRTAPGDRTAARRPSRAETEKTRRRGLQEAPRATLRRTVGTAAAGASDEEEFFGRLTDAGVLVRKRYSARQPGEVTGYAVALPHDTASGGGPVWFGGGKLAADLTLPKLRVRWEPARARPGARFTAQERNEIWKYAACAAADAAVQLRQLAGSHPVAVADVAWAAADTLYMAAAALGSPALCQAADSYDRASRVPFGRIPRPTPAGNSLRAAARLLAGATIVADGSLSAQVTLMARLVALVEAVAELRQAQRHAAQVASARRAAEHVHAAMRAHSTRHSGQPRSRARTAAGLAQLDSLGPPRPYRPSSTPVGPPGPTRPAARPSPTPRPRGPTRG
jgi:hypothetical protein